MIATKPDDVPQFIWDSAFDLARSVGAGLSIGGVEIIARKMMADRAAMTAAMNSIYQLVLVVGDMVEGVDAKAVRIRGPLIGGEPDVMWKWEDEWLHHARAALENAAKVTAATP